MPDKWVDRGLALGDISKFVEYLKLYKASKLVSIKLEDKGYTVVYTCPFKLTENSTPYIGAKCW